MVNLKQNLLVLDQSYFLIRLKNKETKKMYRKKKKSVINNLEFNN